MTRRIVTRLVLGSLLAATAFLAGCSSGLTPAQIALLKQEGFEQTGEGWELGLASKVLFGTDEAKLAEGQREEIGKLAHGLMSVDIRRLRVDGHTDGYGTDAYNKDLSERRAAAVADALIAAGMQREYIQTRGLGKSAPIESNASAAGRRENRRVAVVVANDQP